MKIKVWRSKMGATVTHGRLLLEVWEHGGVTRCVRDDSICGFSGTHWTVVPKGSFEDMAKVAVDRWKREPSTWKECE